MKKLIALVFTGGLLTGGLFMSKYLEQDKLPENVLSSNTVNSPTPTPSPMSTPTTTPTPIQTATAIPTSSPTLTPTRVPSPTPTPQITAPTDLEPLFEEYANIYKVDKNLLKAIADCESHFNQAVLADPYAGMYQFTESTWHTYRSMMGKDTNKDLRFGARESIETAAFIISIGKSNIWPACSK